MYDTVALCILTYFKISRIVIRTAYVYAESICDFVVNSVQGYLSSRNRELYIFHKEVKQSTNQETLSRKRGDKRTPKSKFKNTQTSNNKAKKRGYNDAPPCKKRKAETSRGNPDDGDNSSSDDSQNSRGSSSGGRGSSNPPHGTCVNCNQIFQCNLRKARKVTVSFEFVANEGISDVEFYNFPNSNVVTRSSPGESTSQGTVETRERSSSRDEEDSVNREIDPNAIEDLNRDGIWLKKDAQKCPPREMIVQGTSRKGKCSEYERLETRRSEETEVQFSDEQNRCESKNKFSEDIEELNENKELGSTFYVLNAPLQIKGPTETTASDDNSKGNNSEDISEINENKELGSPFSILKTPLEIKGPTETVPSEENLKGSSSEDIAELLENKELGSTFNVLKARLQIKGPTETVPSEDNLKGSSSEDIAELNEIKKLDSTFSVLKTPLEVRGPTETVPSEENSKGNSSEDENQEISEFNRNLRRTTNEGEDLKKMFSNKYEDKALHSIYKYKEEASSSKHENYGETPSIKKNAKENSFKHKRAEEIDNKSSPQRNTKQFVSEVNQLKQIAHEKPIKQIVSEDNLPEDSTSKLTLDSEENDKTKNQIQDGIANKFLKATSYKHEQEHFVDENANECKLQKRVTLDNESQKMNDKYLKWEENIDEKKGLEINARRDQYSEFNELKPECLKGTNLEHEVQQLIDSSLEGKGSENVSPVDEPFKVAIFPDNLSEGSSSSDEQCEDDVPADEFADKTISVDKSIEGAILTDENAKEMHHTDEPHPEPASPGKDPEESSSSEAVEPDSSIKEHPQKAVPYDEVPAQAVPSKKHHKEAVHTKEYLEEAGLVERRHEGSAVTVEHLHIVSIDKHHEKAVPTYEFIAAGSSTIEHIQVDTENGLSERSHADVFFQGPVPSEHHPKKIVFPKDFINETVPMNDQLTPDDPNSEDTNSEEMFMKKSTIEEKSEKETTYKRPEEVASENAPLQATCTCSQLEVEHQTSNEIPLDKQLSEKPASKRKPVNELTPECKSVNRSDSGDEDLKQEHYKKDVPESRKKDDKASEIKQSEDAKIVKSEEKMENRKSKETKERYFKPDAFQQKRIGDSVLVEGTPCDSFKFERGPPMFITTDFILEPPDCFEKDDSKEKTSDFDEEYLVNSVHKNDELLFTYAMNGLCKLEEFTVSGESFTDDDDNDFCEGDEKYSGTVVDYYNPLKELPKYFDHQEVMCNRNIIIKDDIKCFTRIPEPKNGLHLLLKAAVMENQDCDKNIEISKETEYNKKEYSLTVSKKKTVVCGKEKDENTDLLSVKHSERINPGEKEVQTDEEHDRNAVADSKINTPEPESLKKSISVKDESTEKLCEQEQKNQKESSNRKISPKSEHKSKRKFSRHASDDFENIEQTFFDVKNNEQASVDVESTGKASIDIESTEQASVDVENTEKASVHGETKKIAGNVEFHEKAKGGVERHEKFIADVERSEKVDSNMELSKQTEVQRPMQTTKRFDHKEGTVETSECPEEASKVVKHLSPPKSSHRESETSNKPKLHSSKCKEDEFQNSVDRHIFVRSKKEDRSVKLIESESKTNKRMIKYDFKVESTHQKKQTATPNLVSHEEDPYFAVLFEKGPPIPITPDSLLRPYENPEKETDKETELETPDFNKESSKYEFNNIDNLFYNFIMKIENKFEDSDPSRSLSSDQLNELNISSVHESSEISPEKSETSECSPDLSPATTVSFPGYEETRVGVVIDYHNPMTDLPKYFEIQEELSNLCVMEKKKIQCIILKTEGQTKGEDSQSSQPPKKKVQSSSHLTKNTLLPKQPQGDVPLMQQSQKECVSLVQQESAQEVPLTQEQSSHEVLLAQEQSPHEEVPLEQEQLLHERVALAQEQLSQEVPFAQQSQDETPLLSEIRQQKIVEVPLHFDDGTCVTMTIPKSKISTEYLSPKTTNERKRHPRNSISEEPNKCSPNEKCLKGSVTDAEIPVGHETDSHSVNIGTADSEHVETAQKHRMTESVTEILPTDGSCDLSEPKSVEERACTNLETQAETRQFKERSIVLEASEFHDSREEIDPSTSKVIEEMYPSTSKDIEEMYPSTSKDIEEMYPSTSKDSEFVRKLDSQNQAGLKSSSEDDEASHVSKNLYRSVILTPSFMLNHSEYPEKMKDRPKPTKIGFDKVYANDAINMTDINFYNFALNTEYPPCDWGPLISTVFANKLSMFSDDSASSLSFTLSKDGEIQTSPSISTESVPDISSLGRNVRKEKCKGKIVDYYDPITDYPEYFCDIGEKPPVNVVEKRKIQSVVKNTDTPEGINVDKKIPAPHPQKIKDSPRSARNVISSLPPGVRRVPACLPSRLQKKLETPQIIKKR